MRVLVTGGAGFIGSEFVRLTLGEHGGDSVTVLDRFTYAGNPRNLDPVSGDPRLRIVTGDITDSGLVRRLASESDAIVNFAAASHVDRSLETPEEFVRTNVEGTLVLLEAARTAGHRRFVQVSTDEVYGPVSGGRSREGDRLVPSSPYSASKAGAEMLVVAYRTSYGLPAMITRGCNTYGPYQYPEKVVPLFVTNAIDGLPLPVFGDGAAVRDYLYVSDHCRGIDAVLRRGVAGEDYNLGAGHEIDINTVADTVLRLVGRPSSLRQPVAERPGHDRRYALDSTKSASLPWSPEVGFEAGMARAVAWYRENQWWWRPLKSAEYWRFYRRNYARPLDGAAS